MRLSVAQHIYKSDFRGKAEAFLPSQVSKVLGVLSPSRDGHNASQSIVQVAGGSTSEAALASAEQSIVCHWRIAFVCLVRQIETVLSRQGQQDTGHRSGAVCTVLSRVNRLDGWPPLSGNPASAGTCPKKHAPRDCGHEYDDGKTWHGLGTRGQLSRANSAEHRRIAKRT